jgi:hypothetical protein
VAQAVSRRPFTAEVRVRSRASPCEICGGQFDAKTCFRLHRTSVFPFNCGSASASDYAAFNRRTSGRSLGVFKQAMPCRISGSVGRRIIFTLFFVSCFQRVACWFLPYILLPSITATFHFMPVTHPIVLLTRLSCTAIWTLYLLSAVLCGTPGVPYGQGPCIISLTTFDVHYQRGTSELTRGELPAGRAKQELCIFALSFHLLPCSPESATILIQPWPSGSILLLSWRSFGHRPLCTCSLRCGMSAS